MANFLIVHVNGQIGVGVFQPSGFEVLRCNGELWQEFNPESFWEWFIDKAGLDINAEHGFVIASDQESFDVLEGIKIATHFGITKEDLQHAWNHFKVTEKLKLISYPTGFEIAESSKKTNPSKTQAPQVKAQATQQDKHSIPSEQCGPLLILCRRKNEEYRKK